MLAAADGVGVGSGAGCSLGGGVADGVGDGLGSAAETGFTLASSVKTRMVANDRVRLDIRGSSLGNASMEANSTDG